MDLNLIFPNFISISWRIVGKKIRRNSTFSKKQGWILRFQTNSPSSALILVSSRVLASSCSAWIRRTVMSPEGQWCPPPQAPQETCVSKKPQDITRVTRNQLTICIWLYMYMHQYATCVEMFCFQVMKIVCWPKSTLCHSKAWINRWINIWMNAEICDYLAKWLTYELHSSGNAWMHEWMHAWIKETKKERPKEWISERASGKKKVKKNKLWLN